LIGQLLAFGRRQQLEPRRIDLTAMLQDQLLILQKLVGDRVCVHTEFCPEDCWVQADPSRLDQVVLNLVANARDAMPKGGQLWLATRRVSLEPAGAARLALEHGRFVQLTVRDDGHGMDEHTRDHLFEPFFTTKEPEHGTGLGLATVYGIVRQSGGAIEVQSAVGEGSTFTIWLPYAD
jgi:signal transduction histidine kinase